MSSHTEDVTDCKTTVKGDGGWWVSTIQPLLMCSGPLETGRRWWEMGEDEVGQQDENEKTVHRLGCWRCLFLGKVAYGEANGT